MPNSYKKMGCISYEMDGTIYRRVKFNFTNYKLAFKNVYSLKKSEFLSITLSKQE
jgi:hypothetical protein